MDRELADDEWIERHDRNTTSFDSDPPPTAVCAKNIDILSIKSARDGT